MTDSATSSAAPAQSYRVEGKLGPETTDALVIACSDRRYRRPTEHFIYKDLGLGNYDLVAVPGGVYMLSFAGVLPKQLKLGMQMVKFLARAHSVPRIVLIAHQDCARYAQGFATWLRRPGFSMIEKQKHDLIAVRETLRGTFPDITVDAYFAAEGSEDAVLFEPVIDEQAA